MAEKGFAVSRHELAPGVEVDVYNLHADAGSDSGDIDARALQYRQLAHFVRAFSSGRALVVAGDTNLKGRRRPRDEAFFLDFLADTGLSCAARTLGAPEDIDRVLFRNTPRRKWVPLRWREADECVDGNGKDLSDRKANDVDFEWRLYP